MHHDERSKIFFLLFCNNLFFSSRKKEKKAIVMLNGHSQVYPNEIDELDGLLSLNDLSEFDMGKYTMKLLSGTDRLYRLKTDRAACLMNTMAIYREQELFCDVSLRVKGQRHLAHKIVLASSSPYFASMFSQSAHIEAHTTQDIDLTELVSCPDAMNVVLNFLYTSQVQLNDKYVMPVLTCSIPLLLDDLIDLCVAYLRDQLHASNCVGLLLYGKQYECKPLIEASQHYIHEHFEDVVRHEEFLTLTFPDLCSILKDDNVKVKCESIIYNVKISFFRFFFLYFKFFLL